MKFVRTGDQATQSFTDVNNFYQDLVLRSLYFSGLRDSRVLQCPWESSTFHQSAFPSLCYFIESSRSWENISPLNIAGETEAEGEQEREKRLRWAEEAPYLKNSAVTRTLLS